MASTEGSEAAVDAELNAFAESIAAE